MVDGEPEVAEDAGAVEEPQPADEGDADGGGGADDEVAAAEEGAEEGGGDGDEAAEADAEAADESAEPGEAAEDEPAEADEPGSADGRGASAEDLDAADAGEADAEAGEGEGEEAGGDEPGEDEGAADDADDADDAERDAEGDLSYGEGDGGGGDDADEYGHAGGADDGDYDDAYGGRGGADEQEEGGYADDGGADGELVDDDHDAGADGMYDDDDDDDDDAYNDFDMGVDAADPLAEEHKLTTNEMVAQLREEIDAAKEAHRARLELNAILQRKVLEHLRAVKNATAADDAKPPDDAERASAHEQEQRYVKALANLQTLKLALASVQDKYDSHAAELNSKLSLKEAKAVEIADTFAGFKREIMAAAENSRTGRPIAPKLIRHFDESERACDEELAAVRLTHISRRAHKDKLELTLRQKEKLADGLHLIDFEQLKIENQTLNEKIEERNEELLKLRKKMSTSAHVLTHFKEKLQFVAAENAGLKSALAEKEVQLVGRRDQLTSIKQARDLLRMDNTGMKSTRPLVNSEKLLLDFELRKQKLVERKSALDALQARHSELMAPRQRMR